MIIVTGATGMLGGHLVLELLKNGYENIICTKRNTTNTDKLKKILSFHSENFEQFFAKIKWIDVDLFDYEDTYEKFKGADTVYHCAAYVSFNPKDRKKIIENNLNITKNIVNASLDLKVKLCHVSSIAALGTADETETIDETTPKKPGDRGSAYAESKFLSEMEVWRGIEEGLNAVIVNPSVILGAGDWNNGSPSIFKNVYNGLNFYTEGITGYVDVTDVAKIMIKLVEKDISAQRYILNSENLSYKQLLTLIAKALNKKPPKFKATTFMLHLARLLDSLRTTITRKPPLITKDIIKSANTIQKYDNRKIIETLNYKFIPIEQTVKHVAEIFLREHKNR